MDQTNPMFAKFDQALGKTTPTTSNGPVSSRADEIRALPQQVNQEKQIIDTNKEVGGETAMFPTKPAPESKTGVVDTLKIAPNAVKDAATLAKETTYGTAKKVLYDIPKEAIGIVGEQGVGNAIKNTVLSAPEALIKTAWGLVPQSAKELANTNAIEKIPEQFKELAKQNGGSYAVAFKKMVDAIPDSISPALQNYANQIDKARQSFENHPLNELLGYVGLKSLVENPNGTLSDTKEAFKNTKEAVTHPVETVRSVKDDVMTKAREVTQKTPEEVNKSINEKYTKAIKPSVAGKKTASQAEAYSKKAVDAVHSIVENEPNLELVDRFGERTGKLPQTPEEFSQAINQTKKSIYTKYNELAKTAGEKGAQVELTPIADELSKISGDKTIQDLNPSIGKYADELADRLRARGVYDSETAQSAIEQMNKSLEAYYKNPSYETASKASVDAMVANKLREGLDSVIEKAGGEGYQELKNKYGALKTIEKDVNNRALIEARKSGQSLTNYNDLLSAGEVIKGLATKDPLSMAVGAGMKALDLYQKWKNSPNVMIRDMFTTAKKAREKINVGS